MHTLDKFFNQAKKTFSAFDRTISRILHKVDPLTPSFNQYDYIVQWPAAINSTKTHSHLEPHSSGQHRVKGWIHGAHVILYNKARNKSLDNGFGIVTNKIRLDNGQIPSWGYLNASRELNLIISDAIYITLNDESTLYKRIALKRVDDFLKPFANIMTVAELASIEKVPVNLS